VLLREAAQANSSHNIVLQKQILERVVMSSLLVAILLLPRECLEGCIGATRRNTIRLMYIS
jgi:hypothetical protein